MSKSKNEFRLTDIQQSYFLAKQNEHKNGTNAAFIYAENLKYNLDTNKLQKALNILIKRHDMLRVIIDKNGIQKILENTPEVIIKVHIKEKCDNIQIKDELINIRNSIIKNNYSLNIFPLFDVQITKFMPEQYYIHFYLNLIIADGCGIDVFFKELSILYNNLNYKFPIQNYRYQDFLIALENEEKSLKYMEDKKYWLDKISFLPPAPELPLKNKLDKSIENFAKKYMYIHSERWSELKKISLLNDIKPSTLIFTIYCFIISHWSRDKNFTLNILNYNRTDYNSDFNSIIGNFSSNTLINVNLKTLNSIIKNAQDIETQIFEINEHLSFNGVKIIQEINKINGISSKNLMPIVSVNPINFDHFNYYQDDQSKYFKWFGKDVSFFHIETPHVWLDQQIFEESDGSLFINWIYLDEIFPENMVLEMFNSFKNILLHFNSWNDRNRQDILKLIDNKDHINNIKKINKKVNENEKKLLHEKFIEQVKRQPNITAIINGEYNFSYIEIYNMSKNLSTEIKNNKIVPKSPIAIIMEKGWEQIVAVLGILLSDSYYIPIDATLPKDRIFQLLDSSQSVAIITQNKFCDNFLVKNKIPILTPKIYEKSINRKIELDYTQDPSSIAYVIFTSGSTGIPKGVMIEHRSASNTVHDIIERFNINEYDSTLCFASLSFDLSVFDIFGLLSSGGKIVIPTLTEMQEPECWKNYLINHNITIWNSAPPLMQMFSEYLFAKNEIYFNNKLRLVLLSGDWIPVSLPEKIQILFKNSKIVSLGGATEASIWSNFYIINENNISCTSVPYGRPLKNQTMFIFDDNFEIRPIWVPGLIYIGGIGLARGYLNDLDKTNKAFVYHPITGERFYCTGDYGRYLPSGDIEFLGRQDNQVKIQGYRVELCEIESAILQHPYIANALVRVFGNSNTSKHLIAYFSFKSEYQNLNKETKDNFIKNELNSFISKKLPYYMVPNRFLELQNFPITSNGKIDNRKLEQLTQSESLSEIEFIYPQTNIEKEVANIWQKLLNIDKISVNCNFFHLGGQSFLAFQMMNQIYQKFNIQLPMNSLFQYGTIYNLSLQIENELKFKNNNNQFLISLAEGIHKENFFCIHPSGGNIFCYRELSKYFSKKRSFIAIQSIGINNNNFCNISLEDMAKLYLDEIRKYQKNGPYFLGGWSFGGSVAYEIAKQLYDIGEKTHPVILIDSPIPFKREIPTLSYLNEWFQNDFGEGLNYLDQEQQVKLFNIFKTNVIALSNYCPEKTNIPVIVFKANKILINELLQHPQVSSKDWGWKTLTDNIVNVIELSGDHYSILEKDNVNEIVLHLEKFNIIPNVNNTFENNNKGNLNVTP